MHGYLDMWIVYDHPTDFPTMYVARRQEIRAIDNGGTRVTGDILHSTRLKDIRRDLYDRGFTCIQRHEQDDPKIIEVWI